jgi:hypothetical protein
MRGILVSDRIYAVKVQNKEQGYLYKYYYKYYYLDRLESHATYFSVQLRKSSTYNAIVLFIG